MNIVECTTKIKKFKKLKLKLKKLKNCQILELKKLRASK